MFAGSFAAGMYYGACRPWRRSEILVSIAKSTQRIDHAASSKTVVVPKTDTISTPVVLSTILWLFVISCAIPIAAERPLYLRECLLSDEHSAPVCVLSDTSIAVYTSLTMSAERYHGDDGAADRRKNNFARRGIQSARQMLLVKRVLEKKRMA